MIKAKHDRKNRRRTYEALPKGAYVVKILGAEIDTSGSYGPQLRMAFDIAEGDYKDFYRKQFDADTRDDKKWPFDGVFYLSIPDDSSKDYVWTNWDSFLADVEDSNSGYTWDGDEKKLKGKVVGGKFHIRQTEGNDGTVYDHTKLKWTCLVEDVRTGNAGKMPNDKLVDKSSAGNRQPKGEPDENGFVNIPDGIDEDEVPF